MIPHYGPRLKVKRAKQHIHDLDVLVKRFLKTDPYRIVANDEPDRGLRIWRVHFKAQPPDALSLVIGDAVHNLRSALDHLAFEFASEHTRMTTPWEIEFPIFRDQRIGERAKKLETEIRRKIQGASDTNVRRIASLKPYQGGNEALWRLHTLDIRDKHRLLITVRQNYGSVAFDMAAIGRAVTADWPDPFTSNVAKPVVFRIAEKPLEDGAEVMKSPLGQNTKAEVGIQFRPEIAFAEPEVVKGQPIMETLYQLSRAVSETIDLFVD